MKAMTRLLTCALLLLASTGCFPKMRNTKTPANSSTWNAIAQRAQKAGFTAEQSPDGSRDGKYFWYVKVAQGDGTIYYTKNNSTGGVAFACSGGSLDDSDACDKAGVGLLQGP